jgi:hypothetical protein
MLNTVETRATAGKTEVYMNKTNVNLGGSQPLSTVGQHTNDSNVVDQDDTEHLYERRLYLIKSYFYRETKDLHAMIIKPGAGTPAAYLSILENKRRLLAATETQQETESTINLPRSVLATLILFVLYTIFLGVALNVSNTPIFFVGTVMMWLTFIIFTLVWFGKIRHRELFVRLLWEFRETNAPTTF